MRSAKIIGLLLVLLALVAAAKWTYGQVPQGQILGVVTDPSGAFVPGAKVTLENELTGIKTMASTSDSGSFVFPYLNSGTYKVTVEHANFTTSTYPGIRVQANEKVRVDAHLTIGSVASVVEVVGAAAKLDTDSASIGSIVTSTAVNDLPLNGREFSQLALVMPGVRSAGMTGGNLVTQFATALDVGGTGWQKNAYSIDGTDNSLIAENGPAMNPSIDAIQEFRIERGQFSAEYGRGGAEIMLVTKSGTNRFHGALWEFVRNYRLNAGEYYTHERDNLKRNQFGASLGGPLIKNKAFFFFNWERQTERASSLMLGTTLSPLARTGDLSEYPYTVNDPTTGEPFPGNTIPAERLDPVALSYMESFIPLPNLPGNPTTMTENYMAVQPYRRDYNQFIGRVDYNASTKDTLFVRVNIQPRKGVGPGWQALMTPQYENFRFYNGGIGWIRNWSPSLTTETRLGFHHERLHMTSYNTNNVSLAAKTLTGYMGTVDNHDLISIGGYFYFGNYGYPIAFDDRSFDLSQNATFITGKHLIKLGFMGRGQRRYGDLYPENIARLYFTRAYSNNAVGDYLMGLPIRGSTFADYSRQDMRMMDFSGFVQDDWKVTPSLTLNLGLRYDLFTLPFDVHDVWGSFYPQERKIVVAGDRILAEKSNPFLLDAWQQYIITATQTSLPRRTLGFGDHNNWAPRIGFAWRPFKDNKTVVRGAYGIFYLLNDGTIANNNNFSAPYIQRALVYNTTPTPSFTMADPFISPVAPAPYTYAFDPYMRTPFLQQISLGIQRELPWGIVGEISFLDQNSKKLETGWDLNTPVPGEGDFDPRRPFYPEFTSSIAYTTHEADARYDALEFSLKKTTSHFTFWWNHTWAKSLGYDVLNPYDRDAFYGPMGYVAHLDKLSFVMDLPVGKGKRWLNHGGAVNAVLGGWKVAGIFTLHQSGNPLTVTWSADPTNTGIWGVRPNRICSGRASNPTVDQWFDTSCFVEPTPLTFGNSGSGIFFGPGKFYGDFSALKNFALRENVNLQFRAEFFNISNHPLLWDPDTEATSASFGQITGKSLDPRVIQFALRLTF